LRGSQIGIPLVVTAAIMPAFVAIYSVDFSSLSTGLAYQRRGGGAGGFVGPFDFGTDGASRYGLDVDLTTPGIYDFFLLENITGVAATEIIERSLGVHVEYFVALGLSDEIDVPVIPITAPLTTPVILSSADSFAFSRFFSIEVASPVPVPPAVILFGSGLGLLLARLRLRHQA